MSLTRAERPTLITGGAGFIGSNLADRLLAEGRTVILLDNLARPGVERNVAWLRERHGERVRLELTDLRDQAAVGRAAAAAGAVFHLAAQVAVTTSLTAPLEDFEVNARGTLGLLEALRALPRLVPLVFTSTNKVYGALPDVALVERETRHEPADPVLREQGVSERRPLDFHSPYGCSKGAADQYVIDYARTLGLATLVFRMSCIYGPHQCGTEDQGWVAHFVIRALEGRPVTVYGDGKQVRDLLFIEDLVDAFLRAEACLPGLAGRAFNIGGGPANTLSLIELMALLDGMGGAPPAERAAWRPGDQRYYVSDTRAFQAATGWAPVVGVREGLARLARWLRESGPLAPLPLAEAR